MNKSVNKFEFLGYPVIEYNPLKERKNWIQIDDDKWSRFIISKSTYFTENTKITINHHARRR